ncbi:Uncharacterised protein [Vibrio cholerae]|nr:Uncharacterised protein [Vibrio cholerae]
MLLFTSMSDVVSIVALLIGRRFGRMAASAASCDDITTLTTLSWLSINKDDVLSWLFLKSLLTLYPYHYRLIKSIGALMHRGRYCLSMICRSTLYTILTRRQNPSQV